MKSLNFIKERIASGNTSLSDSQFESMTEVDTLMVFKGMYEDGFPENDGLQIFSGDALMGEVIYDADADFNCFFTSVNLNDGTLMFDLMAMKDVIHKVLSCQTYNSAVLTDVPSGSEWFNMHYLKYTIGNIVLGCEYSDDFGSKEKPWLTKRSSAMLPIKFEIGDKDNV